MVISTPPHFGPHFLFFLANYCYWTRRNIWEKNQLNPGSDRSEREAPAAVWVRHVRNWLRWHSTAADYCLRVAKLLEKKKNCALFLSTHVCRGVTLQFAFLFGNFLLLFPLSIVTRRSHCCC